MSIRETERLQATIKCVKDTPVNETRNYKNNSGGLNWVYSHQKIRDDRERLKSEK